MATLALKATFHKSNPVTGQKQHMSLRLSADNGDFGKVNPEEIGFTKFDTNTFFAHAHSEAEKNDLLRPLKDLPTTNKNNTTFIEA